MAAYQTLDYLPDLTSGEMGNARVLSFAPYTPTTPGVAWDHLAEAYGGESYALLHDLYKFTAREGATYDIFSTSYFDPYLLRIYDAAGNTIVANDEADDGRGVVLNGISYDQDIVYGWKAPYSGTYYVEANWNQGSYYTFYSLMLFEDGDTIPVSVITGTAGNDVLTGTFLNDTLNGFGGNDILTGLGGSDLLNGGDGIDTARYMGNRASHVITKTATGFTVQDRAQGDIDTLNGIERIRFLDSAVAVDVDGAAGQAYRLYQAAFNRSPDKAGLGFHISAVDGGWGLASVAQNFINSPEFSTKYGTLNDSQFVNQLYLNVLHRPGETSGVAYHVNDLGGGLSRAQLLVNFSESPENKAALIGVIQNGMEYIPA